MLKAIRTIIKSVTESKGIKRFSGSGRPFETFSDREVFQDYGFTSRPLQGSEGILLLDDNKAYLIATDDRRYRLSVQDGEVCLYTDEGDKIHFRRGNVIDIISKNQVFMEADNNIDLVTADKTETISNDRTSDIGNNDSIVVGVKSSLEATTISQEASAIFNIKAPVVSIQAPIINMTGIVNITGILNVQTAGGAVRIPDGNIYLDGSNTVRNQTGDVLHQH